MSIPADAAGGLFITRPRYGTIFMAEHPNVDDLGGHARFR
jgi:hypothetical protein